MSMEKNVRQNRALDVWLTMCTVEVALEYSTVSMVLENIRLAAESLVAEGIPREEIKFEVDTKSYYDSEISVTHSLYGERPSTAAEIKNAKRTVTLHEHTREATLRRELAEIEARKAAK